MAYCEICEGRVDGFMRKRKHVLIVGWLSIALLCLAIVALVIAVTHPLSKGILPFQDEEVLSEEENVQKNPNSIAIPGYELLEFDSNKKTQTLQLSNPAQNDCYFQISLYLDGNTLLWKSGLIEPGKTSDPIRLAKVLERGTYTNAVLKYDCFKMDGKTPLNGAETKLTLWVK